VQESVCKDADDPSFHGPDREGSEGSFVRQSSCSYLSPRPQASATFSEHEENHENHDEREDGVYEGHPVEVDRHQSYDQDKLRSVARASVPKFGISRVKVDSRLPDGASCCFKSHEHAWIEQSRKRRPRRKRT